MKSIHRTGFTLIEILVAVGIIGAISLVIAQAFFTTTRSNTKTGLVTDMKQTANVALSTMTRIIQNAQQVTLSDGSACATTSTTTTAIQVVDAYGGVTTFRCDTSGGIQRIASVSATTNYLTSSAFTLGGSDCTGASLSFVCTSAADVPTSVKISFTLSQIGSPAGQFEQATSTFVTTATMRSQ